MENLAGIIFDLDGTLLDSRLDFNYLRAQLDCPPETDILTFVELLSEQDKKVAHRIIIEHELWDAEQSEWIAGAEAFVARCEAVALPMAIVTRNCRSAVEVKLRRNKVPITQVSTREDHPAKPDPSALLAIAQDWRIPVSRIAYVGDYLYDVEAANRAGMQSWLYAPDKLPTYASQADKVFNCFEKLLQGDF